MTAETKNTDKNTDKQVSAPNGLGIQSQLWETEARFIAFQEPKSWAIDGRSGTTYKVDVRVAEGTAFIKVDEETFKAMSEAKLQFGDKIKIFWGKGTRNGEFRVLPVGWERF